MRVILGILGWVILEEIHGRFPTLRSRVRTFALKISSGILPRDPRDPQAMLHMKILEHDVDVLAGRDRDRKLILGE